MHMEHPSTTPYGVLEENKLQKYLIIQVVTNKDLQELIQQNLR